MTNFVIWIVVDEPVAKHLCLIRVSELLAGAAQIEPNKLATMNDLAKQWRAPCGMAGKKKLLGLRNRPSLQ